jgi:hypothetical protein
MIHRVKILSLAYYFTDNQKYASKAVQLLQFWFINNSTKMNPSLQYAEMVPGRNNGSSTGIMDTHNISDIIDAIGLIQDSPSWTKQDLKSMQTWFSKYLNWLLYSNFGKKEAQANNNHATWYDVQVSSIALYLNKTDITNNTLQSAMHKLIPLQIRSSDGRQPFELKRTNSWDYSIFNLEGLFKLANIGQHVGIDLWNFKTYGSVSKPLLQTALDYLVPYALKTWTWSYPQISLINAKMIDDLLCQSIIHYSTNNNNQLYIHAYKSINAGKEMTTSTYCTINYLI